MSTAPSIWMPLYIGDYLSDTLHLSTEEHGAYLLLIMHYWRMGGQVKHNKALLQNITGLTAKKLANVVSFFEVRDGMLKHKRIDAELERAIENKEKNKSRTRKARQTQQSQQQDVVCNNSTESSVTVGVTGSVTSSPSPSSSPLPSPLPTTLPLPLPLPPLPPLPASSFVHRSFLDSVPAGMNLNDFQKLYDVMCSLLKVKKIERRDQMEIANWCERYDIRGFAFPLIEQCLKGYRAKNNGASPASLVYFTRMLEDKSSLTTGRTVRNLASQLRST